MSQVFSKRFSKEKNPAINKTLDRLPLQKYVNGFEENKIENDVYKCLKFHHSTSTNFPINTCARIKGEIKIQRLQTPGKNDILMKQCCIKLMQKIYGAENI